MDVRRVCYDDELVRVHVREQIADLKLSWEATQRNGGAGRGMMKQFHAVPEHLAHLSTNYKSSGWQQEDEWRLVARYRDPFNGYGEENDDEVRRRHRAAWRYRDGKRPYIAVEIEPHRMIEKIIMGPCADERKVHGVAAEYGLQNKIDRSPTIIRCA